jgi:hypothetical protein
MMAQGGGVVSKGDGVTLSAGKSSALALSVDHLSIIYRSDSATARPTT